MNHQYFHVLEAENGTEALNIFEEDDDIDIILSDINMPEMDGLSSKTH